MTVDPTSPLARLRGEFEARRSASADRFVEIWPGGSLVARVGAVGVGSAVGVIRTLATVGSPKAAAAMNIDTRDLAGVIAEATDALFTTGEDGEYEPLHGDDGRPLVFDHRFAAGLGLEDTDPAEIVLEAFTEGDPGTIDTVRLLACAMQFAARLSEGRTRKDAEATVGEASTPGS